ncbi:hypothetical protein GGG16DRAFT_116183 [Schizophyllum commune]
MRRLRIIHSTARLPPPFSLTALFSLTLLRQPTASHPLPPPLLLPGQETNPHQAQTSPPSRLISSTLTFHPPSSPPTARVEDRRALGRMTIVPAVGGRPGPRVEDRQILGRRTDMPAGGKPTCPQAHVSHVLKRTSPTPTPPNLPPPTPPNLPPPTPPNLPPPTPPNLPPTPQPNLLPSPHPPVSESFKKRVERGERQTGSRGRLAWEAKQREGKER